MKVQDIELLVRLVSQYQAECGSYSAGSLLDELNSRINRRHAGRKPKYDDSVKAQIIAEYNSGKSIRDIHRKLNCSVGYIHSVIAAKRV